MATTATDQARSTAAARTVKAVRTSDVGPVP